MTATGRRIYDTGESGADGVRSQLASLEEDLRKVSKFRMWHIDNLVINFNKAATTDVLPLRIAKPADCLKIHAVIPGWARDTSGPVTTTWYPTCEPCSGGVQIRNIQGVTNGKIYIFSLILVGE